MSVTIDHSQIKPTRYAPGSRKGKGGRKPKYTTEAERRAAKLIQDCEAQRRKRNPFNWGENFVDGRINQRKTIEALTEQWTEGLLIGNLKRDGEVVFKGEAMNAEDATHWAVILATMDRKEQDLENAEYWFAPHRVRAEFDSRDKKPARRKSRGAGPDAFEFED